MQHMIRGGLLALIFACCSTVQAADATMDDPLSQHVLAAMSRTTTWGHPDQMGEFAGMRYYADHNYAKAMKWFLEGARYADKLSQLSIGLMYLNGEGVDKDPVTAYAWVAIAAERQYPQFVATRDAIWDQLDDAQRQRAKTIYDTLYATYGDTVAKARMTHALRMARLDTMDFYLGSEVDTISAGGPAGACAAPTIEGAPVIGCSTRDYYAAWRWRPNKYFETRDALWTGTVSVGDAEQVKDNKSGH
ncbi:sel1 repeat family protein [Dyella sp. C11]|uniref:sel1 repeat family protein n=1 Tax=Dyella sp. C11 TaxID=2126991 RepID=UPI001E637862|nr:sel1 repeat family protein [Dyella sp. C11]